ncbi:MAG: glycosyltransferase [Pseudomonadota bacterium]
MRITILLCTLNGAPYLEAQLASYLDQSHGAWDLWVSDDGSTDGTWDIVQGFARAHGAGRTIRVIKGPGAGLVKNYLSALCHPDFPGGAVALSDQDDVWLPHRLTRAVAALEGRAQDVILYGAQCQRTDAALRPISPSRPPRKPAGFANAAVQNVVSGNTTSLSPAALALVRQAGVPDGLAYHDWWLYQLISGAGGAVVIDPDVVALYRQHGQSAIGAHRGLGASLSRLARAVDGTYCGWVHRNWAALQARADLMAPGPRAALEAVTTASPGLPRLRALRHNGFFRQGTFSHGTMLVLAALGRL